MQKGKQTKGSSINELDETMGNYYSLMIASGKSEKTSLKTIYSGDTRPKHLTISFCITWTQIGPGRVINSHLSPTTYARYWSGGCRSLYIRFQIPV